MGCSPDEGKRGVVGDFVYFLQCLRNYGGLTFFILTNITIHYYILDVMIIYLGLCLISLNHAL